MTKHSTPSLSIPRLRRVGGVAVLLLITGYVLSLTLAVASLRTVIGTGVLLACLLEPYALFLFDREGMCSLRGRVVWERLARAEKGIWIVLLVAGAWAVVPFYLYFCAHDVLADESSADEAGGGRAVSGGSVQALLQRIGRRIKDTSLRSRGLVVAATLAMLLACVASSTVAASTIGILPWLPPSGSSTLTAGLPQSTPPWLPTAAATATATATATGTSGTPTPTPTAQPAQMNGLVADGSFTNLGAWHFTHVNSAIVGFTQDSSTYVVGPDALRVSIYGNPQAPWLVQATQSGISVHQGQHLYLSFYAKGDPGTALDVALLPQWALKNQSPEFAYFYGFYQVDLPSTWQYYVADVVPIASDANAALTLNFGSSQGNMWIDEVTLSATVPASLPWASEIAGGIVGSASDGYMPSLQGWTPVWDDEFSGTQVDTTKWNVLDSATGGYHNSSVPGNNYWTPSALSEANGVLRITTQAQPMGSYPYTSGALTTENILSLTYGRIDIRAQLPTGDGLWTGFWLLNADGPHTKNAQTQEVDFMEYLGQDPHKPYYVHHFGFTGDEWCTYEGPDLSQAFHVYTLEWTASALDEYIDGVHTCHQIAQIPSVPLYFLMQTSVEGDFPIPVDQSTVFPQYTTVDYIRVYQ